MAAAIMVAALGTSGANNLCLDSFDTELCHTSVSVAEAQEGICLTHAPSLHLTEAQKLLVNYH